MPKKGSDKNKNYITEIKIINIQCRVLTYLKVSSLRRQITGKIDEE